VLNETIRPWTSITDEDKYWESEAWEWWQVDLAKKTANVDRGLPISAPYIKTFEANKHRCVVHQKGYGKSQIFQLSADGKHKPRLITTPARSTESHAMAARTSIRSMPGSNRRRLSIANRTR